MCCYWCHKVFNTDNPRTADHLFSRPLMRRLEQIGYRGIKRHLRTVEACWACNQKRGRVAQLYGQLLNLKFVYGPPNPRRVANLARKIWSQWELLEVLDLLIMRRAPHIQSVLMLETKELRRFAREFSL